MFVDRVSYRWTTLTMAIGLDKAAVYLRYSQLNGGERETLDRVDVAGGKTLGAIPLGAVGPVSDCKSMSGMKLFDLVAAEATNAGADLELVGTGCATGQTGTGEQVRLEYNGFFTNPPSWSGPADVAQRF
jgi:hypothetical protein